MFDKEFDRQLDRATKRAGTLFIFAVLVTVAPFVFVSWIVIKLLQHFGIL